MVLSLAFVLAVSLHNQVLTTVPEWHLLSGFLISLPLSLLVFVQLGLYHAVVRHMGQAALMAMVKGLSVYHPERIAALVEEERIQRILLAVPSASRSRRRQILEQLEPLPVHVLSIPGMAELVAGQMKIDELQDVSIGGVRS